MNQEIDSKLQKSSILSIQDLVVEFDKNQFAVHDLSFDIPKGKTFVLLGESGCGKSMTANSILQLLPDNATINKRSKIIYKNIDLLNQSEYEIQKIRGESISMIFQDPMTALNPVMKIGDQIAEILIKHFAMRRDKAKLKSIELLLEVGIDRPEFRYDQYPHQLSGGQKQRIMIAIALAGEPELLIADEPTTALDVTIQAQILCLLKKLQKKHSLTILLITHDLGVATLIADIIGVMYAGHLLEIDSTKYITKNPLHPYTQELLSAIPSYNKSKFTLETTSGIFPKISDSLLKCRYIDRCPAKISVCNQTLPEWNNVKSQKVRCHLYNNNNIDDIDTNPPSPIKYPQSKELKDQIVLSVRNLSIHYEHTTNLFRMNKEQKFQAVNNISFDLFKGKTLAIVGESGSGKTSLAKAIIDLVDKTSGKIYINGICLSKIHRKFRRRVQMVFQNVHSSLNPKLNIIDIILEGIKLFENDKSKIKNSLNKVLEQVGLSSNILNRYPHQLSGGQRQRVAIARSLILSPEIIILDEPTSSLDVSIQAQILTMLKNIQKKFGISYILISHDISVVGYMADEIIVMYRGDLVEAGSTKQIIENPTNPYTKNLLNSVPENIRFENILS
ncbi:MAG: ABC transporter ATP-binding protein, partial [Legionellales bacterium]|nr:ABC transporter ATP-binding protein [Legionellales bacterium]